MNARLPACPRLGLKAFALPFLLALAACGSLEPSDDPPPTYDELRAEFGPQAPGTGIVRQSGGASGGGGFSTSASHHTTGGGQLTRFYIQLNSSNGESISMFADNISPADLHENVEVIADVVGTGDGNRGTANMQITSIDGPNISAVFVADLSPGGLYPDFRRIRGAFNAVPDTTQ